MSKQHLTSLETADGAVWSQQVSRYLYNRYMVRWNAVPKTTFLGGLRFFEITTISNAHLSVTGSHK